MSVSWLSFTTTVGKLSIPLNLSKLNDQRQWFYLKNDNDENVIGILTSLYCEVSESFMLNNTLNITRGNLYPRGELSCENLHSNLINTLLNKTMNAKESNPQCITSNKVNNTCYIGSCDYTNDRTLQKDDIKSIYNNRKSIVNNHMPTDVPIQNNNSNSNINSNSNNNNNVGLFSPIHTDRKISFQTTNQSLHSIETILDQIKDNSYIEGNYPSLILNSEFIQKLSNKVKDINEEEEELNSKVIINSQLNEKIKEKENILKRERNKLEEKYRKYKVNQAEYETKSLNLAQSNIQFENDHNRFMLEKEIFIQDKDNFININIIFSSINYNKNITDLDINAETIDEDVIVDTKVKRKSIQKSKTMSIPVDSNKSHRLALQCNLKKKKEIILENPSNYNITKSKSKPNSTGSTTNYTSGNNSEVTSNDYQNVFYNTSLCQDVNSNIYNAKYFAPIAEINLTNSNIEQREVFNTNPLADSLEYGMTGKKAPVNSTYIGRSAMRKNSKQYTNGSTNLHLTSEITSNNLRKKSVKNATVQQSKKFFIAPFGAKVLITKKDSIGVKSETIANTISSVSSANYKNGLRLSKKNK